MIVLSIDPGTERSAWMVYDTESQLPVASDITDNDDLIQLFRESNRSRTDTPLITFQEVPINALAIEMIASYGMAVGAEVFETCTWIGRFEEALYPLQSRRVLRREVKLHLCASPKANDSNIRQALLDLYGGKAEAVGSKKAPGPLFGIKADIWSALAVAITYAETIK